MLVAFFLVASVVMFSGFMLGGPVNKPALIATQILDGVGGLATLVFGVWLAIYLDEYEISDGWILAAIVVWALAAETGRRAHAGIGESIGDGGGAVSLESSAVRLHWLYAVLVVALLAIMIWKPGA